MVGGDHFAYYIIIGFLPPAFYVRIIYLFIYLFTYLFIYLFICLFMYLFIYLLFIKQLHITAQSGQKYYWLENQKMGDQWYFTFY